MGVFCRNSFQILLILRISHRSLTVLQNILILLLENIGINSIFRISCFVILFVFCHFINKEEGKYLDAFMEQFLFSFQMRVNRLSNLNSSDLFFIDLTHNISGIEFDSIQEFYGIVPSVNSGYHVSFLVLFHLTGMII